MRETRMSHHDETFFSKSPLQPFLEKRLELYLVPKMKPASLQNTAN